MQVLWCIGIGMTTGSRRNRSLQLALPSGHRVHCTHMYTVSSLLHDAGRHRLSDHPHGHPCGPDLERCRCEDDHGIQLRLVVAALNQVRIGTYTHYNWQRSLVDFFNAIPQNEESLTHNQHLNKTHAVDKWLRGECLSDDEMKWINEVRAVWRENRDQLKGFDQFKPVSYTHLTLPTIYSV